MSGDGDFPPIHDRPSLYAFIGERLDTDAALADSACPLPDETRRTPGEPGWMAGALDGVITHHMGGSVEAADAAERIARAIATAAARPQRDELVSLYGALAAADVLSFLDPAIDALVALQPPVAEVARLGLWLASQSPDRGPLKVGVALVGICGAVDSALLHVLGAHEEFTLYAAVAFANSRPDPDPDLFALAKRVHGWGRIQCVERLRDTTDPEISRWILTEGFRNTVMNEYLAYIAATTGRLADALTERSPGRDVLSAAGEIIDALIAGGPAEDVDDYAEAPLALSRWLHHMDDQAGTLADLLTIGSIAAFCERGDWDGRYGWNWTPQIHDSVKAQANALLGRPDWPELVRSGLRSADPREFWKAERCSPLVGVDPFDHLVARLQADPVGGPWFQAWQWAEGDRAAILAGRAAALLDLEAIASGPAAAHGLGSEISEHSALNWTLQGLRSHPSVGAEIVAAAMRSPAIQNRNGALNTLDAWGAEHWSAQHLELLAEMAGGDPDEQLRQRAAELAARDDQR